MCSSLIPSSLVLRKILRSARPKRELLTYRYPHLCSTMSREVASIDAVAPWQWGCSFHPPKVLRREGMTPHLDIFKKDAHGNPIWLAAVADLATARLRLAEFAAALPGEYFVFDHRTHKVVPSPLDQVECT
jgi:hypothetical protein